MKVPRLYDGAGGESHFEEIEPDIEKKRHHFPLRPPGDVRIGMWRRGGST